MSGVLYLTKTGLLEPLGQSQVLNYLRIIAKEHPVTLITFEKAEDFSDKAKMEEMRQECVSHGIDWHPKKFRKGVKPFGSVIVHLVLFWAGLRMVRTQRIKLIHARSYLPAGIAWTIGKIHGTPFVFDMRALWPEELISSGRLSRGSMTHKFLQKLERICLRDAAGVVSLTEAAVHHLKQQYSDDLAEQKIVVIPTCVDLERFALSHEPQDRRIYSCVGTLLSGWFLMDWLAAFFEAVGRHDPDAEFEIITRDDKARILTELGVDLGGRDITVTQAEPAEIPGFLKRHAASSMFFVGSLSKVGSAPTRMAEILASGVPVVANSGVGDVAEIIRRFKVGVVVEANSSEAMDKAVLELHQLMDDPDIAARCRQAAEDVFSLQKGAATYIGLYRDILGHENARP